MSGGRHGFAVVNVLLVSMMAGCGDRGAKAPADDTGQPPAVTDSAAGAPSDTARGGNPDTTGAGAAARPDTAGAGGQPDSVAQTPRPKEASAPRKTTKPKPAAPKRPPPATMEAPDTQTAAAPAESTPATPAPAEASAPLRDAYHQAPRDTVTQQVYDGWKQYNLNCARCHGEDVQGTTIAPHLIVSLKPGGSIPTKELFMQTVCAGRPEKGMPAWCPLGLDMTKIEAMYFYVKGRSEGELHLGRPALRQ